MVKIIDTDFTDADFAEQSAQEQEYRRAMQDKGIPAHMHDGVIRFVMQGRAPDTYGFLYAVLSNNLIKAFAKADSANLDALQGWTRLLHNDLPHNCYGSPEKVDEWAKYGGLEGMSVIRRVLA